MSKTSKNEQSGAEQEAPIQPLADTEGQERGEGAEDQSKLLEARADEALKRVAELQAENSDLKDQYLRKLADYENFRKRMFREKDEAVQFANAALLQDLLGILDDFDRAIQSSEVSREFQVLYDGIEMVHTKLLSLLEGKYGLARYESSGKPFDPNIHEAIAREEGSVEEPIVAEEFLKGYTLNGRLLRTAKVRVRMPEQDSKRPTAEPPTDDPVESDELHKN